LCTFEEQRAREAARLRADLNNRSPFERARRPRDAPRKIEIENEVLTEALFSAEVERLDHHAQRRQSIRRRPRAITHRYAGAAAHGEAAPREATKNDATRSTSMRLDAEARPSAAMLDDVPWS